MNDSYQSVYEINHDLIAVALTTMLVVLNASNVILLTLIQAVVVEVVNVVMVIGIARKFIFVFVTLIGY